MDVQKSNYGYPKFISKNPFLDILKYTDLDILKYTDLDIQKSNYRYSKVSMIFGYPKMYFRIS